MIVVWGSRFMLPLLLFLYIFQKGFSVDNICPQGGGFTPCQPLSLPFFQCIHPSQARDGKHNCYNRGYEDPFQVVTTDFSRVLKECFYGRMTSGIQCTPNCERSGCEPGYDYNCIPPTKFACAPTKTKEESSSKSSRCSR